MAFVLSYIVTNFIVICSAICGLGLSADPPCCSVHNYGSTTANWTVSGFDPIYSWSWLTKYFAQPRKNFSEPSITMLWHFSGVDLLKGKLIHQHWIVPSKSQCSISLGSKLLWMWDNFSLLLLGHKIGLVGKAWGLKETREIDLIFRYCNCTMRPKRAREPNLLMVHPNLAHYICFALMLCITLML